MTIKEPQVKEQRKRKQQSVNTDATNKKLKIDLQPANTVPSKKQQKKALLLERKSKDPYFDQVVAAKKVWECARTNKCSNQERRAFVSQIINHLKGCLRHLCSRHDVSRMLQTCIRFGKVEDRNVIAKELVGSYAELASSKYGKHLLFPLMENCPSSRLLIRQDFEGRVLKLVKNKDSSSIIDTLFTRFLDEKDRNSLMNEFYGQEFVIFKDQGGLDVVINKNPAKRSIIMGRIRSVLDKVLLKETLHHSIVHRLVLDYMKYEDSPKLSEWISNICEFLPEVAKSKDGANAAILCLGMSTAKERKKIVKSLKVDLLNVARSEHQSKLLFATFALVDDTKLVGNALVEPLCENLEPVIKNLNSRRCLLFLLGGQNPCYIPENFWEIITSSTSCGNSKKDQKQRFLELRQFALPLVIPFCTQNWDLVTKNSFLNGVLIETLCIDQDNSLLEPLHAILCQEIEQNSNSANILNLSKKISKRAEEQLALRITSTLTPAIISSWANNNDGKSILLELSKYSKAKTIITDCVSPSFFE